MSEYSKRQTTDLAYDIHHRLQEITTKTTNTETGKESSQQL